MFLFSKMIASRILICSLLVLLFILRELNNRKLLFLSILFSNTYIIIISVYIVVLSATVDCPESEFLCTSSGACISKRWTCDGERDCSQGEDEAQDLCRGKTSMCLCLHATRIVSYYLMPF